MDRLENLVPPVDRERSQHEFPLGVLDDLQPAGPETPYIAVRGGSWTSNAAFCRPANRFVVAPHHRLPVVGFRPVYSVDPG